MSMLSAEQYLHSLEDAVRNWSKRMGLPARETIVTVDPYVWDDVMLSMAQAGTGIYSQEQMAAHLGIRAVEVK